MWYKFLPGLLNMSITGGIIILAVLLVRLLLRPAPKIFSHALWAIVLLRLLCPISISSSVSVLNLLDSPVTDSGRIAYIPEDIVHTEHPAVDLPIEGASKLINDALPQGEEQLVADPLEAPVTILTYIWFAGAAALLLYSVVKLLRLKRALVGSMRVRDNIYLADHITSPFVIGAFRPKIYLPSSLSENEQSYIILHEQTHIRRLDHIIRILAFFALCVHWFNPLVWVAFILSGKDMEMSCDEAVIKRLGGNIREDYSRSLVSLATGKRIIAGTPLAFGEGNPKSRIKNVLNYKKPAFWIVLLAVIICITAAACLLTNPSERKESGLPDIAGTYIYENRGPGGDFMISLNDDGTFLYYVEMLSVDLGRGYWSLDGDILRLEDQSTAEYTMNYYFTVSGTELIFSADDSDAFRFVDVADQGLFHRLSGYDLDHDGVQERLLLTASAEPWTLQVIADDETVLWTDEAYSNHAGWNTIFVCRINGEDYLLRYHPTMYQGYASYSYTVFWLKNGKEQPLAEDAVDFDTNWGVEGHQFDPASISTFVDGLNNYLDNSKLIMTTDDAVSGWIDPETPQEQLGYLFLCCGLEYDYDNAMNLQENLEELEKLAVSSSSGVN